VPPAEWQMLIRRVIASVVFVALTPVLLVVVVFTAGAGHGIYSPAKILFPYTMAATSFTREIVQPFIALAIVQYPVYGILLDWARYAGRVRACLLTLAAIHLIAVAVAFLISDPSFTP
jgi:hypothetical protein